MSAPFATPSAAAWALLDEARAGAMPITRKAASFLGQTALSDEPLSEKQATWLMKLLANAGLPSLMLSEVPHAEG